MSSILKALRKLEEEEESGRPHRSNHPLPDETIATPGMPLRRDGPRRLARIAGVGALAIALVGGFAWWLNSGDAPAPVAIVPPQPAPAPQIARAPAPIAAPEAVLPPVAAEPEPSKPRQPTSASAGFVSVANDRAAEEAAREAERKAAAEDAARRYPARRPAPEARPPRARPAPRPAPIAAPEPAPAPVRRASPAPEPAPVRQARPAPTPTRQAAAPTPRPAQRSSRVIPAPPAVTVEKTFWHPTATRRTAEIRLPGTSQPLTIREGETVASLTVTSIEPTAVVFDHEGRTLRRRVGERR